jgi:threonine synthase
MKDSAHYIYRCFTCQREYSASEIEPDRYLCSHCGKSEKQQPLEGTLSIEYDYAAVKRDWKRERFLHLAPGRMWEYPHLWPLQYGSNAAHEPFDGISTDRLSPFALPQNQLGHWTVDGVRVDYLDDTRNLTASFKDRASLLVALKALQFGIHEISASSTGNAGTSLAGICARLQMTAHIWVPENIPQGKLLQLVAYGARVYLVQGDYDAAFDIGLEMSLKKRWYNRNTGYNPLTIEGKKSAAYDIFLGSRGNIPDIVIAPTGDGVVLSGLYKGFWELRELGLIEKIPRLVAAQSDRSDAVCRYLKSGTFEYLPATTIADSINAGAPRNLYMAAHAVRETNGAAVAVSDENILLAQKRIARECGLLVEPAAASSFACYLIMRADGSIAGHERALLLFTGHGLKDPAAMSKWIERPPSRSADEWRKHLA